MKTCKFKSKIIDYIYGELSEVELDNFNNHINNCSQCLEYLNQCSHTNQLLSNRLRPLPRIKFLKNYHQNLKKIYRDNNLIERISEFIFIRPPIAVRLAEVTIILILGIFIGNSLNKSEISQPLILKENIINTRFLNNYLFETELLLLETSNVDSEQDLRLVLNNNCNTLLQKTLLLKEQAEKFKNTRLLNLLSQLEIILMDLANMEESRYLEELTFVKNNIKDWHLLVELKAITSSNNFL